MCLLEIRSAGRYSSETGQNKDLAALIRTGPPDSPSPAAQSSSSTPSLFSAPACSCSELIALPAAVLAAPVTSQSHSRNTQVIRLVLLSHSPADIDVIFAQTWTFSFLPPTSLDYGWRQHIFTPSSCLTLCLVSRFFPSPSFPSIVRGDDKKRHLRSHRLSRFSWQLQQQSDVPLGPGGPRGPPASRSLREGGSGGG